MSVSVRSYTVFLLAGAALFVAGCTQQSAWPGGGQQMVTQNPALDPPMQMTPDAQSSSSALPVDAVPVAPVHERVMAVSDPQLADRIARLERNMGGVQSNVSGLESDVAGLQEDVTYIRPRVEKVEAMEKHFRQLSLELDRINKTYDMTSAPAPVTAVPKVEKPTPVAAAPVQKKAEVKPAAQPKKPAAEKKPEAKKASVSEPLKVQKVRIGEQANGKTRIVLDTTAPAKISYDIDNGEKILVIELPGASWAAQKAQNLKNSGLVSSYAAEGHDGGSRLIVQLKDAAQVLATSRLDPAEGAGYRVFLDLAKK